MVETLGNVPAAKISSLGLVSFDGGLDQRGAANIRSNAFSFARNVMVTNQGLLTQRLGLVPWLPDVVGPAGQVYTGIYNGVTYHITADNGEIKYCVDGASSWSVAGGTNTVTTVGATNTFIRILDKVLILNGVDYLGYLDLSTLNVVHFTYVADPTLAPTATNTGMSGTGFKIYYCISYDGVINTTNSSPILTQVIGKIRDQWIVGTDSILITDPNTRPTGAVSWNIYMATAPIGATIALSDMSPLVLGLDLSTTTFKDDGSITQSTNLGLAPTSNTTKGAQAKYGVEIGGRPFLWGITGDEYAIEIGGDDVNALSFTPSNGGYRLVLNEGTDYLPTTVTGFRNGTGTPSITVLYSSVDGIGKASIISQDTVSLGTYSATVWGSEDQNYGAAGVSSPYAVLNYRGRLVFPSTDGITNIDTSSLRLNVLTATRISDPVIDEVSSIRTDLLPNIVGTAWDNRIIFSIPGQGFDTNNELLIYDVTRQGDECWYIWDIPSQWIGTVSPPGSAGFVYVSQDNHFFYLETMYVAQDQTSTGLSAPFSMEATSALIGTNGAHDGYFALVQAVFYLRDFIGSADLIVTWRDRQSGEMKTRTRTVSNGTYTKTSSGGWSSPGYLFNQNLSTNVLKWGGIDVLTGAQTPQKNDLRFTVAMGNVVTNEMEATISINADYSGVTWRSVSFQGQPLGISPDV
jgi:hypothetical protein